MKKFLFLFAFISVLGYSQTHRFIYEYKYIPNINEKDTIRKEMMGLDIDGKGSIYQSLDRLKSDSTMRAEIQKAMATGNRNMNFRGNRRFGQGVNYKVTKEYPDFKVFLHERVGRDLYKISEDSKPVWKILPETQQIGEYKGQKATTEFGGRSWIAWFSSEIPFQDGPYKFHGLPGLIVKLEDVTGSHVMTLVANKKLNPVKEEETKTPGAPIFSFGGGQEIPVTKKQFLKVYQDYLLDPAKNMREMSSGMGGDGSVRRVVMMRGQDGREINPAEMAKNIEKGVKESEAKNNNRIEPDIFPKQKK